MLNFFFAERTVVLAAADSVNASRGIQLTSHQVLAGQDWELSTSGGGAALASTRGSRTSAASGDIREGSGNCGPGCQGLGAEIWPFPASRTRPVTVRAAGPSSQAITGATCSAASGSSPGLAGASPSHSVRRVRATGATALTVAPYRPSSSAPTRASMATAALVALYAASARKP